MVIQEKECYIGTIGRHECRKADRNVFHNRELSKDIPQTIL